MVILFLVFLLNILVLAYFLFHQGLVTDFSEPPNLFALAVNSPPSHLFAGSCGGGPGGKQYVVNWFVNNEGDHLYMEPGEKAAYASHQHTDEAHAHIHAPAPPPPVDMKPKAGGFFAGAAVGLADSLQKIRQRGFGFAQKKQHAQHQPLRPASVAGREVELEDAATRTQKDYFKLSKRTSVL